MFVVTVSGFERRVAPFVLSLYPSTSSTTSVRADSSKAVVSAEPQALLWSRNHDTRDLCSTLLGPRSRSRDKTTQILNSLSPKRDCGPKRVNSGVGCDAAVGRVDY